MSVNAESRLDDLMHYPTNIKAAQIAEKRRKFDKLPSFVQAGLFLYEKLNNVRRQEFLPKLFVFDVLKNEGNSLFAEGKFEEAARKYEEALCLFRYIKSESEHWREEGIDDRYLAEVDTKGTNEEEQTKINSMKLLCYLNLAACNLKLNNPKTAVDACDEALKIDPQNVKALYRKAKAEMMVGKCGDQTYKQAVSSLEQATQLDPANDFIRREYNDALKRLKETEESKQGLGNQGALNQTMSSVATTPYQDESKLINDIPELSNLNEALAKGENAIKVLEMMGKFDQAQEQKENLNKIKHVKECLMQLIHMDLEKPAQKMKDQAKLLGITFSDEEIMNNLLKMKQNNLEEARELIRKSLGLPKLEHKAKTPEQAASVPKPAEEEKFTFENTGTIKGGQTEINDMEKPDSQIIAKAAKSSSTSYGQFFLYGVIAVLIAAILIGYFFMLFHNQHHMYNVTNGNDTVHEPGNDTAKIDGRNVSDGDVA